MQSLKSTAFAVTLLAISFGLYCVSSDKSAPETDTFDPFEVQIDDRFSTSQSGSISLPSHNLSNQSAPIQISTNVAPSLNRNAASSPAPQLPQLPQLQLQTPNSTVQMPNLNPNFSASATTTQPVASNTAAPANRSFANAEVEGSFSRSQNRTAPIELKLPEIATRQPFNNTPRSTRDDGLINALKTSVNTQPVANDNSFKFNSDNSYNSQATAITKEEDISLIKNADGGMDLGMRDQPQPPTKPAPASIASVWAEVDRLVAADEYRKALGTLSQHYGKKGLTGPQKQKLQGWLDALAGKVIYSTEHLFFKKPHVVRTGETLATIASQFNVPAEIIYNINRGQFTGTNEVQPGMQLKMVEGPFHAEVNLETKMMTLFVKNLYAGRFPVAVGISGKPGTGNYEVKVKSPKGFTWRDGSGKEYPPGSPGNGYGPYWMGLSGSLCIHAVPAGTPHGHHGCIGLSEKDAKDVYGILSKDSQISIVE